MITQTRARRFEQVFLTTCFLAALCVPVGAMLLRIKTARLKENRALTPFPQIPARPYGAVNFPRAFGRYFNDRFGFRDTLIRAQATVRLRWLRTSSSPQVTLGKDGWLYYTGEDLLDYYSRTKPFTEPEMARWLALFESRKNWLKQRGIP